MPRLVAISDLFGESLDDLLKYKRTSAHGAADALVAVGPLVPASRMDYEYKSGARVFGIPLVHINWKRFGGPPAKAKGVIAVGSVAVWLVTLGAFRQAIAQHAPWTPG